MTTEPNTPQPSIEDDPIFDEPAPKRQCELGSGEEGCPVCE